MCTTTSQSSLLVTQVLQHDELQHLLFVPAQPYIPALVRCTNDVVKLLNDLLALLLLLEIDGRPVPHALREDPALDRILRRVAVDCGLLLLAKSAKSAPSL